VSKVGMPALGDVLEVLRKKITLSMRDKETFWNFFFLFFFIFYNIISGLTA
jgi:hypothetical protein